MDAKKVGEGRREGGKEGGRISSSSLVPGGRLGSSGASAEGRGFGGGGRKGVGGCRD